MKNIELDAANFGNNYLKGGLFVDLNFALPYNGSELSIERLTAKELGSFFHEYIHFYQNVATTFGAMEGMIILQRVWKTLDEVKTMKEISIPYQLTQSPNAEMEHLLQQKLGEKIKDSDYDIHIDNTDIKYEINGSDSVVVKFKDTNSGTYKTRKVGTWDLKEGMAAKCQSLIDSNNQQSDIPYNILWILCKKIFPCVTPEKFITICYCSLFYRDPIVAFFQMCNQYNNIIYNAKSIFDSERNKFYPCYFKIRNEYLDYIKKFLGCEIPYIKGILERMGTLPLIDLIDGGLTVQNIKNFLQKYGVPLIRSFNNSHFEWHFPGFENKKPANDVVVLKGKYLVYDYITGKSTTCSFLPECNNVQDDCYDNKLWNVKNVCLFKKIWNDCGFNSVKIS